MSTSPKKVIFAALIGNTLVAITKLAASSMTGSSAMFSEGIHSVVDTGNQGLLLLGLRRAKRPADEQHPFGYGKEIYFWSFVVAMLIFGLGAGISIYEGIHHLIHPQEMKNVVINYVVLGLAMLFEAGALTVAVREFQKEKGSLGYVQAIKRGKDPTLFVVLFEDSAAMLGLVVAFLGIGLGQLTGIHEFDGIASIVIGLILAGTALWLAYETMSLLIGEGADPAVVRAIRKLTDSYPEVTHINEVATLHMGPSYIVVNISVDFVDGIQSEQLEAAVSRLDRDIKNIDPAIQRVFVEAEAQGRASPSKSRPS